MLLSLRLHSCSPVTWWVLFFPQQHTHQTTGISLQISWFSFAVQDNTFTNSQVVGCNHTPQWKTQKVESERRKCRNDQNATNALIGPRFARRKLKSDDVRMCRLDLYKTVTMSKQMNTTEFKWPGAVLYNYFSSIIQPVLSPQTAGENSLRSKHITHSWQCSHFNTGLVST